MDCFTSKEVDLLNAHGGALEGDALFERATALGWWQVVEDRGMERHVVLPPLPTVDIEHPYLSQRELRICTPEAAHDHLSRRTRTQFSFHVQSEGGGGGLSLPAIGRR